MSNGNGQMEVRRVADDDGGGFAMARPNPSGGMIEVASTRAAQEVQAAMVVAKRFPRDETASFGRIMQACKRKALAERAVYAYPRGGETVTGPSIRLAEVLAQSWGNIDFGVIELEQKNGESTMQSYAWDLETNTRQAKIFTIKHERHTKRGVTKLTDPRDIYELAANQGSRRLRACILGIIPGDVVDAALAECEKTVDGQNKDPLPDRIRKMVAAFAEIGVTQAAIEARLKHKMDATTAVEVLNLGKIFNSIRDGFASADSFFGAEATGGEPSNLAAKIANATAGSTKTASNESYNVLPDGPPADPAMDGGAGSGGADAPTLDIATPEKAIAAIQKVLIDRYGADVGFDAVKAVKLANAMKTQAARDQLYAAAIEDRIDITTGKIKES